MILGALCMIVANLATLLGAHALLARVRLGRGSVDFVLFLLIRIVLISVVVLAAGLARVLLPWVLGLAGLLTLGALVAAGAHRRLPCWRMPAWGTAWIALLTFVGLRLLLQTWFFAPYLGDSLSYALPKVAEWVRAGGFDRELGTDLRATFPAGFELIETWWVLFLHHDLLIELAGIEFLLLSAASVYAIADGLGWEPRTAKVAAMLFLLNPAAHLQATSCINDGPVTALVLAAAALIVAGAPLVVVLLPVALGAGVKPTFVYAAPGLAVLAALLPRGRDEAARVPRTLCALLAAAVFVGIYWYGRNWAVFGNPIHPMGPGGMKNAFSGGTLQRFGPSLRSLHDNLAAFLDIRIYDRLQAADAMCSGGFAWGAAGFAGALALVPVLREDRLLRRLAIALIGSTLCIFLLIELDPWNARFVVFLAVLPALALARLWHRHRAVAAIGSLALLLQIAQSTVPGNLEPDVFRRLVGQGWRTRSADPAPQESAGARVAFCGEDYGQTYPLYLPDYSRGVVYLRDETADDLLAHLDREAVTIIYTPLVLKRRGAIFEEGVRRGRLNPVRHGSWTGYEVLPRR